MFFVDRWLRYWSRSSCCSPSAGDQRSSTTSSSPSVTSTNWTTATWSRCVKRSTSCRTLTAALIPLFMRSCRKTGAKASSARSARAVVKVQRRWRHQIAHSIGITQRSRQWRQQVLAACTRRRTTRVSRHNRFSWIAPSTTSSYMMTKTVTSKPALTYNKHLHDWNGSWLVLQVKLIATESVHVVVPVYVMLLHAPFQHTHRSIRAWGGIMNLPYGLM